MPYLLAFFLIIVLAMASSLTEKADQVNHWTVGLTIRVIIFILWVIATFFVGLYTWWSTHPDD